MTRDIRFALRSLRRRPGLTAVALLTLALGIGPATGIFSLANWIALRPVPGVRAPEELAIVWYGVEALDGFRIGRVSYPNLQDLTGSLRAWSDLAGVQTGFVQLAVAGGGAERLDARFVTAPYFRVLGVQPTMGRPFDAAEDDPVQGGAPVALISHRLWISRFDADPEAIGTTVRLNDQPFEIIGVLPAGFHGTERLERTDIWLPGSTYPYVNHFPDSYRLDDRDTGGFYAFVGRRAPGATWSQAEAELEAATASLLERYPGVNEKFSEVGPKLFEGIGLPALGRERVAATLRTLSVIVGLILLIACGNVANLLLFRLATRRGERAVRTALGATRGRLARQNLTEHLMLWVAGGGLGLLAAWWLVGTFESSYSAPWLFGRLEDVGVDWRVMAFVVALSLVTGTIFGALSTLSGPSLDLVAWLKDAAPAVSGSRSRVRSGLSVLQMSATLALLALALLFFRTLRNLNSVELGFDPDRVVAFNVSPGDQGYSQDEVNHYYRSFVDRLNSPATVQAAAISLQGAPFAGVRRYTRVHPLDGPGDTLQTLWNAVSMNYLQVLQVPLIRGRWFADTEVLPLTPVNERVVVLSQSLAQGLFGDREALGQSVEFPVRGQAEIEYRVIGIVGDLRWAELEGPVEPMVYEPLGQGGSTQAWASILVRGRAAGGVLPTIRATAESLDAGLPIFAIQTLEEALRTHLAERRLFAKLTGLLALLAVALGAVGLYALLAYGVASRTREMGVRLAVGAEGRDVLRLVMGQALRLTVVAAVLGLVVALVIGRAVASRLYGVSPLDPATYAAATTFLFLVALLAAFLPARAATRVDPVIALRQQ